MTSRNGPVAAQVISLTIHFCLHRDHVVIILRCRMSYFLLNVSALNPPSPVPRPNPNLFRGNASWGFYLIVGVAVQIMTGMLRVRALEARQSNFSLLHRVRLPFYDRCSFTPKRFKHVTIVRTTNARCPRHRFCFPPPLRANLTCSEQTLQTKQPVFSAERKKERKHNIYSYIQ